MLPGLCGLYDGDPHNDLRLRNGSIYQFTTDVHPWSFPPDYCSDWRYMNGILPFRQIPFRLIPFRLIPCRPIPNKITYTYVTFRVRFRVRNRVRFGVRNMVRVRDKVRVRFRLFSPIDEMGLGEMGLGELGLGEMGQNRMNRAGKT